MRIPAILIASAFLVLPSASAQIVVFDNLGNNQKHIDDFEYYPEGTEIGDEVNLLYGAATVTDFTFSYHRQGNDPFPTATVRFYDKTGAGGTKPGMNCLSAPCRSNRRFPPP